METTHDFDVIIIGAGAAGLSAAQMLGRSLRSVLVLDTSNPRNRFAGHMHGVLGGDGLSPRDFLARGRAEATAYGVQFGAAGASTVAETATGVAVATTDGSTFTARRLIAATGVRDDLPPIPGLAEGWGRDVLHCPYCHGWEVRGQRIGVLATSPMGLHQAHLLRQWSNDVVFLSADAGPIEDTVASTLASRDVVIEDRRVLEVTRNDAGALTGVRLEDGEHVGLDAIFTAGELHPQDGYLDGLALDRDELPVGSFIHADFTGKTNNARIFAAGNITNPMANVPISMAAGTMAGSMVNMDLVTEDFDLAAAGANAA
ncbi:NAD(P)/FAD-dependent oxidoreductase [Arthrobacter sp.]|uniref:NAD(P)/FAD-dependent oxidoreductase n=1 Tax=Arthrobacter sp. TaxID=1667 RepID=UPI003A909631